MALPRWGISCFPSTYQTVVMALVPAALVDIHGTFSIHSSTWIRTTGPFAVSTSLDFYYFDNVNGTNWPIGFDPVGIVSVIADPWNSDFSIEQQVAAVPEASTWAMLLIGFAGIRSLAFRRKNAKDNDPEGVAFEIRR